MEFKEFKRIPAISIKTHNKIFLYDRFSNNILVITKIIEDILDDTFLLTIEEIEKKYSNIYDSGEIKDAYDSILDFKEVNNSLKDFYITKFSISRNDDNEKLNSKLNNNLTQLIFNVTEDCNLRCKYCIYSGEYNIKRSHNSDNIINWDTAKKAIGLFVLNSKKSIEKYITFYGGEPLLNFKLIKKIIEYTRKIDPTIEFSLTSNATLLKSDHIEFFIKNTVHLTISLDGPRVLQDENRVFRNGKGTFDTVYGKIEYIRSNYPEYFEKKVSINCVIAANNQTKIELEHFFTDERFPSFTQNGNFSSESVNPMENGYYKKTNYNDFIQKYFNEVMEDYKNLHVKGIKNEDELPVILRNNYPNRDIKFFHFREDTPLDQYEYFWPNGICIPGMRSLFVSSDGIFYPCEKLYDMDEMEIGNINIGIDVNKVNNYIDGYALNSIKNCRNCWAYRLCGVCFLSRDKNTGNIKTKQCNDIRHHWSIIIKNYIEIIESNPSAFDYFELSKDKQIYINDMVN